MQRHFYHGSTSIGGSIVMLRHMVFSFLGFVALALLADWANAASTDRTVLYALTEQGALYKIDLTTGTGSLMRQLPSLTSPEKYHTLVVYKGTFLALTGAGT